MEETKKKTGNLFRLNGGNKKETGKTKAVRMETDPMAAFSGNKRSKVNQNILQEHFRPTTTIQQKTVITPPPALASQIMHQQQESVRSPMEMVRPSGMQPGTPLGNWNGGSPGFGQGDRASHDFRQGRGYWSSNSPGPAPGRGSRPSFGQGGRPNFISAQGRGSWPRNSHIPGSGYGHNLGRGRGQWSHNSSPSSAHSGGRRRGGRGRGSDNNVSAELRPDGRGSDHNVSAELRPELYYNKSMVEDPWKFLKPVMCIRFIEKSETPDSWLPKSIRTRRTKVSAASRESKSQLSLAENSADSFNEAIQ